MHYFFFCFSVIKASIWETTHLSYVEHRKASHHIPGNFFSSTTCAVIKWHMMLPRPPGGCWHMLNKYKFFGCALLLQEWLICIWNFLSLALIQKYPRFAKAESYSSLSIRPVLWLRPEPRVWVLTPHGHSSVTAGVILRTPRAEQNLKAKPQHILWSTAW